MKDLTILAVSVACHDGSICLLKNGEVIFYSQEERLSRIKQDSFLPFKSLRCIKKYVDEIDLLVVVNAIKETDFDIVVKTLEKEKITIKEIFLDQLNHHLFHAASSFYGSGFDNAVCLVIDGWGSISGIPADMEHYLPKKLVVETTTIYKAEYPSSFEVIYKNLSYDPERDMEFDCNVLEEKLKEKFDCDVMTQFDIGVMYGSTTELVLENTDALGAGKLMGLSSYGKEDESVPPMLFEDSVFANANLFKNNRTFNIKNYPQCKKIDSFEKKANYAYAVQKALEKVFVYRINYILEKLPETKNIVFSGGCALNILGNTEIKKRFPQINFYVDPIANDACQAYGAAMYNHYDRTNDMKKRKIKDLYWGQSYNLSLLEKELEIEVLKINHKNNS